jgi:hypothetical protein
VPAQYSRADAVREFLTGAGSDGGTQTDPNLSLGNYHSATEAATYSFIARSLMAGVSPLYAGGGNPPGLGVLSAPDGYTLTWQCSSDTAPGSPTSFPPGTSVQTVESLTDPGQYLRISAAAPFTPGVCLLTLNYLYDNVFALADATIAEATAGEITYRATMLQNASANTVTGWQRCLALLGTPQVSNVSQLPSSGNGTLGTTGAFADWPAAGFCQVRTSGGTLREVVYYGRRTNAALTVPAAGRALLGTSAAAGSATEVLNPVSGCAIGLDPAGVQAAGSNIQTVANETTAPTGVTWNLGITPAAGLQVASAASGDVFGVWVKRQLPAAVVAGARYLNYFTGGFTAP